MADDKGLGGPSSHLEELPCELLGLPDELLSGLLSWLPLSDRLSLGSACRHLRTLTLSGRAGTFTLTNDHLNRVPDMILDGGLGGMVTGLRIYFTHLTQYLENENVARSGGVVAFARALPHLRAVQLSIDNVTALDQDPTQPVCEFLSIVGARLEWFYLTSTHAVNTLSYGAKGFTLWALSHCRHLTTLRLEQIHVDTQPYPFPPTLRRIVIGTIQAQAGASFSFLDSAPHITSLEIGKVEMLSRPDGLCAPLAMSGLTKHTELAKLTLQFTSTRGVPYYIFDDPLPSLTTLTTAEVDESAAAKVWIRDHTRLDTATLHYNTENEMEDLQWLGGSIRKLILFNYPGRYLIGAERLCTLTDLEVWGFHLNDISPISGLPIRHLTFVNCAHLHDLTPLATLTQLQTLRLRWLPATTLVLAPGGNLRTVRIADCSNMTNFDALKGQEGIRLLAISRNDGELACFDAIGSCKGIRDLRLANISNLAPVGECARRTEGQPGLQHATLWGDGLTDLSPLTACTALTSLHLHAPTVSSVAPLTACVSLQQLHLSRLSIRDLTPIVACSQLTRLELKGLTLLADLGPLADLGAHWLQLRSVGVTVQMCPKVEREWAQVAGGK